MGAEAGRSFTSKGRPGRSGYSIWGSEASNLRCALGKEEGEVRGKGGLGGNQSFFTDPGTICPNLAFSGKTHQGLEKRRGRAEATGGLSSQRTPLPSLAGTTRVDRAPQAFNHSLQLANKSIFTAIVSSEGAGFISSGLGAGN